MFDDEYGEGEGVEYSYLRWRFSLQCKCQLIKWDLVSQYCKFIVVDPFLGQRFG